MSNFPTLIALMMTAAGAGAALSPASVDADLNRAIVTAAHAPVLNHMQGSLKAHTIYRSDDGFFYLSARINGKETRFLVDTGANMVMLPQDVAELAGIKATGSAMATTAGGLQNVELSSIASLQVGGIDLHHVPVAIQRTQLTTPLLGVNTLSKLGRIEIDGDKLTISPTRPY